MLTFLLCYLTAALPAGGALIQTLPPDGAWVEFDTRIEADGKEHQATWVLQSVGKTIHAEKPCRWIEMAQTSDSPRFPPITFRLLIPEDEFGPGKFPVAKALGVWGKPHERPTLRIPSLDLADPLFFRLQQGPLEDRRELSDTERVDWQRGKLDCRVEQGTTEFQMGTRKSTMTFHTWRHADVPFHYAGGRIEVTSLDEPDAPPTKITLHLRDHGMDAKPKLPEVTP